MTKRDQQIVCGLLLSKFDRRALNALGFSSFLKAFNVLAAALGAKPASIKNYRDELDPYFPNRRQGWHKRQLRSHCEEALKGYGKMSIQELIATVEGFLDPAFVATRELRSVPDSLDDDGRTSSFAQRLVTGRAAEKFFLMNFTAHTQFEGGTIVDTTSFGCGFDFRINFESPRRFCAIEVKGLHEPHGGIALSAKEKMRAEQLGDDFYLYVVSNFRETPRAQLWRNPLDAGLDWRISRRRLLIDTWTTTI